MHVLISIKAVGFLVKISTIAEEICRVVTHLHMANQPLHVTHALRVGGLVVMLDVDAGLFALHGILFLCHNNLRQQEKQGYYEPFDVFHHNNKRAKIRLLPELDG